MEKNKQKKVFTIGVDASRAFVSEPTGVEFYSWNLIKNLAKIDRFNNYILYLRPGQKVNFPIPRNFKAKTINLRYLWTQIGLARELFVNPVDLLFVPAHTLPLLNRWIMRRFPTVVTIHGLEGKYLPQSGNYLAHLYRNWSIGWSVLGADRLIAVSADTRKDVVKTYQVEPNKLRVIHEGVDLARFKKSLNKIRGKKQRPSTKINILKSKYKLDEDFILFVGTVQPRKNLERLIEAFSHLLHARPLKPIRSKLKLVIAGGYGWLFENILSAPARFGVKDNVVFTGRVSDSELNFLYNNAKLFVLPSLTEGFGLPILEAQASGLPVVASTGGALKEVAGKGAVFVNPLSVKSIAKGLETVLKDEKLQKGLVIKGYQNIQAYTWEQTAHNTIKYFLEILNGKNK